MNARSALFDVYGDHLLQRGGAAPVAALLRLLGPLGIAPPAVRTAISRMAGQGWLAPVRLAQSAGYRATPQAERRLAAAAHRIYRQDLTEWDGRWHLLVVDHAASRTVRERLRTGLAYLGYAPLREATWISPRESAEVEALLLAEGVQALRFQARYVGDETRLATSAWDLDEIAASYQRWLSDARVLLGDLTRPLTDEAAFTLRSRLVHEWRKFLFTDPGLPRQLLPPGWPGDEAAAFFDEQAERLSGGAGRFVDACLAEAVAVPATGRGSRTASTVG